MARPKKDPLAPVKPKTFEIAKLPIRPGRMVTVKFPLGGLTYAECEFVKRYLPLLIQDEADPDQLEHEL